MFCPLNGRHRLIEIAPGLWQCPKCGFGPTIDGSFPFWAISCVDIVDHEAEALAIKYDCRLDAYVSSCLRWIVDEEGKVLPGTVDEDLLEYISTKAEKGGSPLPAIYQTNEGPRPRLRQLAWESHLGPKVL